MKITFEGDFNEIQDSLLGLFGESMKKAMSWADQAAASAAKADSAARNAAMALADIKKAEGK